MRLYPPAWIVERQALADDVVGGFRVPKGSVVGVSTFVMHRHPRWWSNPEGFDPDRFAPEAARGRPKHAYLPFGGGPRTCIGNQFALQELVIMTAVFLKKFRVLPVAGFPVEPDALITLRPKHGMKLRLEPRWGCPPPPEC